eukprot:SAG11_NODE_1772_length_4273_cov_3.739578_9_plen_147_part_00
MAVRAAPPQPCAAPAPAAPADCGADAVRPGDMWAHPYLQAVNEINAIKADPHGAPPPAASPRPAPLKPRARDRRSARSFKSGVKHWFRVRAAAAWKHDGDMSETYGLEPNYGCCTANFNQGAPCRARARPGVAHRGLFSEPPALKL